MAYTQAQLKTLYATALGDASRAGRDAHVDIMAAIAMAESGGDATAEGHNSDGTIDRGLWQINSRHIGESAWVRSRISGKKVAVKIEAQACFDPWVNACYAATIYERQGYGAWSTYTTTDPKRSYKRFLSGDKSAENPSSFLPSVPGGNAVKSALDIPGAIAQAAQSLNPQNALSAFSGWANKTLATVGVAALAAILIVLGLVILMRKTAASAAISVATDGLSSAVKKVPHE